ncbi:DNA polymerase/3'-5' exonuclease PolX [Patescibacteria group bacterium]
MINKTISEIFQEIGDILEIKDENRFKILAYHRAAQIIRNLATDLSKTYKKDPKRILEIKGIGKDLYLKIVEIIETGKCDQHQRLLEEIPGGVLDMLRLRGVGPKKVKMFYITLGLKSPKELEKACRNGKIHILPGMGERTELSILKAIDDMQRFAKRTLMPFALEEANLMIDYMKKKKSVNNIEYAGSLRRRKETVGDIDILVAASKKDAPKIMEHFVSYDHVEEVLAHGKTKSSIVLNTGIQIDLRVVEEKSYGAALHYFTGSKAHNIALRDRAKKKGLKVSEYGVFKGAKQIAGKTEESVFKSVGLPFIIPELRKNDGEIEAALKDKLPKSIELKDIQGDLHMHTNASDGTQDLETVAENCRKAGYKYIAITDHSKTSVIAKGLDEKKLLKQFKEIDKLNKKYKDFTILKGCEIDILKDGKLDFSDEILAQMDIFPASIHSGFTTKKEKMTDRIIKAMSNPYVKIIGHPTGRLINRRDPYELDMDAIIDAAKEYKVALELNAQPLRLDLKDIYLRRAKEKGVKITIGTDSHHTSQQIYMSYGIYMARRGWLEKKDVLNTRTLKQLLNYWK